MAYRHGLQIIELPLRQWLELGQYITDLKRVRTFKYFRKWHTQEIALYYGKIKVDGVTYKPAIYVLKIGNGK